MLVSFRESSRKYREALLQQEKDNQRLAAIEEANQAAKRRKTEELSELQKEKGSISSQLDSVNKTLLETTAKLTKAVQKHDFAEVNVCSAVVESMTRLSSELQEKLKKTDASIQKIRKWLYFLLISHISTEYQPMTTFSC